MPNVSYEWDIETETIDDDPEVLDHWHADALQEYPDKMVRSALDRVSNGSTRFRLVLVRDDDAGRSWAYVGAFHALPPFFQDAYEHDVTRVPKRFQRELKRYATNFKQTA